MRGPRSELWFLILAVVVAGPLLGGGYLLLLDWPSGPRFAEPVWFPLPSSGDLGNLAPLNTLHTVARAIHPYLPDKLFLVLPVVLGGLGVYRLVRRRLDVGMWGAIFGGTLFVVNPFVLDRYLSGQLYLVFAYSLLPWAAGPLYDVSRNPARRSALMVGLWLGVFGAIDIHVTALYALLVAVVFAAGSGSPGKRAISGVIAFGVGLLLWAFWLLPAVLTPPGGGIGAADLPVYASRPQGFRVLPALAAMHGFWRDEFIGPAQRIPALYLLLIPILGLVVVGLVRLLSPGPARRFGVALAVTAGVALVLAAGTSLPPTAGGFSWLFDHVYFFRVFREPQKFLALVVLAYAVVGASGFDLLRVRLSSIGGAVAGMASTVAVLAYSFTMLWGFGGQVQLSTYPDDWGRAEEAMVQAGPGRLLVFPWHLYAVWSFSDGRISANPAPSFFSKEVLVTREAGFQEIPTQSPDPFAVYIDRVLAEREVVQSFGHLVAPLGVRYVALLNEVNRHEYRFLGNQADLEPVFEGSSLVVYENTAWRMPPIELEEAEEIGSIAELIGSEREATASERLYATDPLTPAPLARALGVDESPPEEEAAPGGASFLFTNKRCTDDWRVGSSVPLCQLGAAAIFSSPKGARRSAGVPRATALALSTLTLLGCSIYVRKAKSTRGKLTT